MGIKLLSLAVASFITIISVAQGLKISPAASFKANAGVNVVIHNFNLANNGNGDLSNSNLYVTGEKPDTVGGTTATTASNLYINKASSSVALKSDLNVINNVVFQNGLLDLSGHNLLLSPAGSLVAENEFNHITGPAGGFVSITVPLNAPAGANPGNLGAIITSSKDLGSVVVQRGHNSQQNQASGKSILRYFNIQPSNNTALNAVFRFTYLDAELNGLTESGLSMWKSTNGGSSWTKLNASGQNIALNFAEISNAGNLARYTLSSAAFTFSSISSAITAKSISPDDEVSFVSLAPNPVSPKENIIITTTKAFNSNLIVFTADGRKAIQQQLKLNAGTNNVTVDMHSLSAGAYYLVVEMHNGTQKTIPFIKQ
jgi:hypothetical protein